MYKSLVKWVGVLLVVAGGVSVSGQQVVRCKSDTNCAWSIGSVSQFECCVTFENGLTYIVPGLEGCFVCIVFGFNATEFIAVESEDNYTVEIRVIKGLSELVFPPVYRVQMKSGVGNVDSGDVLFEPKDITLNTNDPILIPFKFILDGVEREQNETFTLEMVYVSGTQSQEAFFTQEIEMVIIDGDIPSANLTFEEYRTEVFESETDNTSICIITVNQEVVNRVINLTVIFSKTDDTNQATKNVKLDPFQSKTCFLLSEVDIFKDDDVYEQEQNFILSLNTIFEKDFSVGRPANIILKDNDTITVGWKEENYDFKEDEENTSLCIIVTSGSFIDIPLFGLELTEGTAKNGTDFLINSTSFKQTDDAYCINIFMIDDEEFGSLTPENFTLRLVFDADLVTIVPDTTYISITDNEILEITITGATVNESEPFQVCASKNTTTVDEFVITITSSNGTAESGKDFAPERIPSTIILQPEETVKCFISDAINDDEIALEPIEFFTLTINNVTPNDVTRINLGPSAIIIINDNDEVVIGFLSESYSVNESDGTISIEFGVITGSLGTNISIQLNFSDETALSGSDYISSARVYSLTGRETVTVDIGIIGDNKFEQTEVFYASLSLVVFLPPVTLQPDRTEINITDADTLIFSFGAGAYSFMESIGTGTIYVDKISGSTDLDITLQVSGILQGGQRLIQTITFSPLDSEKSITFNIIDDLLALEPLERFMLDLAVATISDRILLQPYNRTNISIIDDNELIIGFAQSVSVPESENATLCITFSSEFSTNFRINVGPLLQNNLTLSGIAESGTDYYLPHFSIEAISTSHGPNNNLCFDVSIIQDEFLEYEECFAAVISLPNSVSDRLMVEIAGGKDTAVVCIENDDRITISFDHSMYSVGENAGTVQISASLVQGELERPVEVLFSTMSGTATSEDPKDFQSLQSIVFQFNDTIHQAGDSVTIINDNIFEKEEKFFASLITNDADVDFRIKNATITIVDDGDRTRFGFDPVQYRVNEGAGSVTLFVVLLEGILEREVNLQFSTIEGTATSSDPADYGTDTRTITFSSSISNVSVSVTIYNDDIWESAEHFLGKLIDPRSQATVSIMPNTANVDIMDNDRVIIGFERTNYLVKEGNVVEVCAVLTGTVNRSLEVFVNGSNGSATVDEDYNPVLETLTFGPTSNRACFNFTTLEDEILEENIEDLNLQLSTMALNAILNPFLAHVHIHDGNRATGPTILTVDDTTSNKQSNDFAIAVVAGAVVLLVVAMMTIVIVMIAALRCRHSALDLQKKNKSEPLQAIKLSSITVEEDLDSHI